MRRNIFLILVISFVSISFSALELYAEEEFVPGDILYTYPVESVVFSHMAHVKDASLTCDTCHPAIFRTRAYSAQNEGDFNMASIYDGKYCGACHNGEMAFSSNTQCARCHTGVKGLERAGDIDRLRKMKQFMPGKLLVLGEGLYSVNFSHNAHKVFRCNRCHTRLFGFSYSPGEITMNAIEQGLYCGACHNGEMAFSSTNCVACHEGLAEK